MVCLGARAANMGRAGERRATAPSYHGAAGPALDPGAMAGHGASWPAALLRASGRRCGTRELTPWKGAGHHAADLAQVQAASGNPACGCCEPGLWSVKRSAAQCGAKASTACWIVISTGPDAEPWRGGGDTELDDGQTPLVDRGPISTAPPCCFAFASLLFLPQSVPF